MQKAPVILVVIFLIKSNSVNATLSQNADLVNNSDSTVVVSTSLGRIRGVVLESSLHKSFYAFRGIRYAQPPVDELRFKAPEPVQPWIYILDATEDGPSCIRPRTNESDMSEDCLRLNIYTPAILTAEMAQLKPVIVYLHPGGFYVQSAQSWNFAGPEYFMDRDVVLVTLNYRLGLLGLLSTGTADAPGNAALKDQVMALKWIRSHINKFGGDPNSITLLGYSAGAHSITLHLVSSMSQGLFHKAIVMSGSGVSQKEVLYHQLDLAKKQAGLVSCPSTNVTEMVNCLRSVDAIEFARTLRFMFDFFGHPVSLYKPVIEPDFGQERFLVEHPQISYEKGDFMKIPIITGINTDEFAGAAMYILNNDTLREQFNKDFDRLAAICFMYERDTEKSKEITKTLKEKYLGDTYQLDRVQSLQGFAQLFADAITGFANYNFVNLVANGTKVFHYKFSYKGNYSHYLPYKGVVHHDDLLYLFHISDIAPVFTSEYPERKTVERLTRMWTNFAAKGDPNNHTDAYLKDLSWEPFSRNRKEYLDIGEDMIMKKRLYAERFAIWENIFPHGSARN